MTGQQSWLKNSDKVYTAGEAARTIGTDNVKAVKDTLARLANEGKLIRVGRGQYQSKVTYVGPAILEEKRVN